MRLVHADHVITIDGPSISDGAIVVDRGSIVDVGPAAEVIPRHAGLAIERVRGVVLPGLVNAHTHLELSALRGRVSGGRGFIDWVERLIGMRTEIGPEEEELAIDEAVRSLVSFGTVAVGEVTNSLGAVRPLARAGLVGCIFHEIFGLDRDRVMARLEGLRVELETRIGKWPSTDLTYSPAPHTLYTTHEDVVRAAIAQAKHRTSLHLAEHAQERRAIEHGDGPVPEWLAQRSKVTGFDWPKRPLFDHAEAVGALSPNVLLVHLTDAKPAELARVAAAGAHVVLCPRSNLHIEAQLPPLLAMRDAGVSLSLGTDSLASSPSLDVLSEARALRDRFPSVPPQDLCAMATRGGALALDRHELGRIVRGAQPGLVAVESERIEADAAAWLLANVKLPRRVLDA